MTDYDKLLERAHENLPEIVDESERFTIPEAEIIFEGNSTVMRNFSEIASILHRKPIHFLVFLLREIGTGGSQNGRRAIFKGRVQKRKIQESIEAYVNSFVLCSECHRPDTHLMKEGRTPILKCDACGAHRTVKSNKASSLKTKKTGPTEGDILDLKITGTGRKGDGMAKIPNYIVFVDGAKEGQEVKAKITRIMGKIIQATPAE